MLTRNPIRINLHYLHHLVEGVSYIYQPEEVRQYLSIWERAGLVEFRTGRDSSGFGWYLTPEGKRRILPHCPACTFYGSNPRDCVCPRGNTVSV
jgi:hypothetical protein